MLTREFMEAVKNNDVLAVKIMLKDSLLSDPTFNKYDEMRNFAETNLAQDIWEPLDRNLDIDMSNITREDLITALVEVVDNFSKKRITIIQDMIKKLYPQCSSETESCTTNVSHTILSIEEQLHKKCGELQKSVKQLKRYHQTSAVRDINEISLKISELCNDYEKEKNYILNRKEV